MILKACLELCNYNGIIGFKNNAIVKTFYDDLPEKNKWCSATLKKPSKQRTTGQGSQNSLLHGDIASIVFQAKAKYGVTISPEQAKEELKEYAVLNFGYPTKKGLTKIVPESTKDMNQEDFKKLLDAVQDYADKHNFWLIRTDELGEYKSIYNTTREYMDENYPEFKE